MNASVVEHHGVVYRIASGKAVIAMETGGCASCGHGGQCGIGKLAAGRPATLLTLPADASLKAGDTVTIALPVQRLNLAALLGYLFPALAIIFGAWLGLTFAGGDVATALGAVGGFIAALIIARVVTALAPGLMLVPRLIPVSRNSTSTQQEP